MSEINSTQDAPEQEETRELTKEEYDKAREDAKIHLKKEIIFLKVEKEYEILQADIEEAKTRRISMIAQQARFYAPSDPKAGPIPEGSPVPESVSQPEHDGQQVVKPPTRKLKTD